ncbi:MAG TPA: hydrogenase expression/formation protein [Chloroflexi bacterium]|nr:hydrogenase expression/formation protein [Chloroflexota bacterium]
MPRFAVGKLPTEFLGQLLDKYRLEDERVVLGARIGEDAAALDMGDRYLVAKADPVTFATDEIGWYAVHVNANDIATTGAVPLWFLATVLLPEHQSDEALAERILSQMYSACKELGVSLVGGHTEITYGLDRPIVVGHMLGEVAREQLVTSSGAQVGDAIVLTKGIAIEGTALIAREKEADLRCRSYGEEFLARAQRYLRDPGISVVREARLAGANFEVHAMHDPTEGGLAMGLHELAGASGVGLRVDAERIEILPECRILCQEFGLDPLGAIASGALLIVVPAEEAEPLLKLLGGEGIAASVIGHVRPRHMGTLLKDHGQVRALPTFPRDEIARLFA